ncbi:MAG: RDD family protein [Elusimicrobia bacterium]|nr:RDD family protein [Elusimicrobiota bacterium]
MADINIKLEDIQEKTEEKGYVLAGFNERFIAYLIDTLPFVLLNYITFTLAIKTNYIIYNSSIEILWKLFWLLLFIIYEIIFTSGKRVTLGKMIMGLKVLNTNGTDPSVIKAFIRVIGYFIDAWLINIGYLLALTNKKRRSLHDFLASTIVIRTREKSPFVEGIILVVSWGLMAFFIANWANRTILAVTPSEQIQINEANRTIAKIGTLEEIHYRKYGFYTNDIKRLADLTGNVKAVRYEIANTLADNSLEIATDGRTYDITARARNWRKTKVKYSNMSEDRG